MSSETLAGFSRMIPRLRAEEELRAVDVHAVGTGAADKRVRSDWLRARVKETGQRKPVKARTLDEHHAHVAAIGFAVEIEEVAAA